jgi:phosphoribosylformylglycinamidine cyclo-ligase
VLPEGTSARIDRSSWDVPALFTWLVDRGDVPDADAWRTFNMGIGMVLVVAANEVNHVLERLAETGESEGRVIGEIINGNRDVQYAT